MPVQKSIKASLALSASIIALPLGLSLGVSSAAQAQEVSDEIIVTATRRAESIQDIPLNISALGGEEIAKQGLDDLSELAAFVPGLNIADQGGRDGNRIVVRGLNVENIAQNFGQANGGGTVATYVGEIPAYVDLRLNDLERVEVLLGPQGTLYGSGTMGGAIRYIPNKPDFDGDMMELRADAYSYSEGDGISSDIGITANAAISDNFAIRASMDLQNDKGFIDYPYVVARPGFSEPDPDFTDPTALAGFNALEDANTEDIWSGRVAARWQPSNSLDATLTYYFQNGDFGGRNTTSFRNTTVPSGRYEYAARVPEPAERNDELLALEIVADLGFAELTSASGIGGTEFNGQRDQTDLLITLEYYYEFYPTFTGFTFEDEKTEIINQELRLVSTSDGPLSWIVGGFYNENEFTGLSTEFTPGIGAFNADFGFRQDLNDLEYFATSWTNLEEKALFGEVGYDVSEAWNVTVGARYYDYVFETADQTEFPYFTTAADFPGPYTRADIKNQLTLAENQSFDDFLFKVNTSYDFGDHNIYATFSQGFRVGASNAGDPCPDVFVPGNQALCLLAPGQQFGPGANDIAVINERDYLPDTVDNYELGAKTTWLDGALKLNAAVFFMDWKDPQVGTISVNAGTSITVNAGAAESKGVELSADWDLTDRFNLRGSFSHTKAELTEGVDSLVTTIVTTGGFGTDFENGEAGDRLPGSPETQFSVLGSYSHPLTNGDNIFVDAGYSWQGNVLQTVGQRGGSIVLPSFGRANAAIGYERDNWSIVGYVDNIFDDFAETSAFSNPRFSQTIEGANVRYFRTNVLAPRTIGARMKYRFD